MIVAGHRQSASVSRRTSSLFRNRGDGTLLSGRANRTCLPMKERGEPLVRDLSRRGLAVARLSGSRSLAIRRISTRETKAAIVPVQRERIAMKRRDVAAVPVVA
jgi:hypothetical protein